MEILSIPIEKVKGVGAKRASALKDVEILTLGDLLYYLPRRYLDRTQILPMARVPIGQEVTLIGEVRQTRFIPGSRPRFVMVVADETDDITCTFFQGGALPAAQLCRRRRVGHKRQGRSLPRAAADSPSRVRIHTRGGAAPHRRRRSTLYD